MGNVKDFFAADLEKLQKLERSISRIKEEICKKGKTYEYALNVLNSTISEIISRLE